MKTFAAVLLTSASLGLSAAEYPTVPEYPDDYIENTKTTSVGTQVRDDVLYFKLPNLAGECSYNGKVSISPTDASASMSYRSVLEAVRFGTKLGRVSYFYDYTDTHDGLPACWLYNLRMVSVVN